MDDCYKFAAATPHFILGHAHENVGELIRLAERAAHEGVAVLVYPELCLTGYTCGDLFYRSDLESAAQGALMEFAAATKSFSTFFIIGLPIREGAGLYNSAVVIGKGKVLGVVHKHYLPTYSEYYEKRQFTPAAEDEAVKIFDCRAFRFGVEICEDGWGARPPSSMMASVGVDVIFNLSASTDFLGKAAERRAVASEQSARLSIGYVMACAGVDESCSDAVFGGASLIAAGGKIAAEMPRFHGESRLLCATLDLGSLRHKRFSKSLGGSTMSLPAIETIPIDCDVSTCDLDVVSPTPFLDEYGEENWVETLLDIQSVALARRMESAHAQKLVIGVSGGADSALALMGAARALARRGKSAAELIALVMPGMGSSAHTQETAIKLATAVGARVRVIDICEACARHLVDIGHDPALHDIAYENVQARERTQILMDVANMEGALVVGTGDLSEIALGWNTYNGDHMSMYQINASVPKTMVLEALRQLGEKSAAGGACVNVGSELGGILREISAAPITPELVPGAVANDTEARLGPYILHDFFLYHYVGEGASAAKLLDLARVAFRGVYTDEFLEKTRDTFIRRFFAAQYKRNCVPDGPKITLSLSPRADWRMPSDMPAF